MFKITIKDKNLNKHIYFKENDEVDFFIDEMMCRNEWGIVEDLHIKTEEMTKEEIEAIEKLSETDWYIIRAVDPSSEEAVPGDVVTEREDAREGMGEQIPGEEMPGGIIPDREDYKREQTP